MSSEVLVITIHKVTDREGKSLEDHTAAVLETANSGGYRMLLCQPLNIMWYIVTGQQIPQGEERDRNKNNKKWWRS